MSQQPTPTPAPAAATPAKPLTPEQQRALQMQAYLRAPVPKIYANGIGMNGTSSDISIALLTNSVPAGILSMSYTTAKSLADEIYKAITYIESVSGEKIKSVNELAALQQAKKK